jgi:hypothetical protein
MEVAKAVHVRTLERVPLRNRLTDGDGDASAPPIACSMMETNELVVRGQIGVVCLRDSEMDARILASPVNPRRLFDWY